MTRFLTKCQYIIHPVIQYVDMVWMRDVERGTPRLESIFVTRC